MRYYYRENVRRYEKMTRLGLEAWSEWVYGGTDLHDFSSRAFLEVALPMLRHDSEHPSALALGTGVGPGAHYLNASGYTVAGYDLIPEAIESARQIADSQGVSIRYDVMDVTRIPHEGEAVDTMAKPST